MKELDIPVLIPCLQEITLLGTYFLFWKKALTSQEVGETSVPKDEEWRNMKKRNNNSNNNNNNNNNSNSNKNNKNNITFKSNKVAVMMICARPFSCLVILTTRLNQKPELSFYLFLGFQ